MSEKKPTMKDEFRESYIDSIKRNISIIGSEIEKPQLGGRSLVTPEIIEQLATNGLSKKQIKGLLKIGSNAIDEVPEFLEAFQLGRSKIGSQIRAKIIDQALEGDNLQAQIYLDKLIGGDTEEKNINLTVDQRPLKNATTEQLIEIEMDDGEQE